MEFNNKNLLAKSLIGLILLVGICLRLNQYFANKSLWLDELWITLNIINKSFIELLKNLDYHQSAPIGFLMIEKIFTYYFGNSEYVVRLFPLFCSLVSLFIFYKLTAHILDFNAGVIAILLFATCKHFIYHASEAKQYSSDLLITLILLLLALELVKQPKRLIHFIKLCFAGFILMWFSHASIFILLSISIVLLSLALFKRKNNNISLREVIFLILGWGTSFFLFYTFNLCKLDLKAREYYFSKFYHSPFMPWPLNYSWLFSNLEMLINSVGFEVNIIVIFLLLSGCILICKKSRAEFFILFLPLVFTLLASALHKYPILDRLMLFYFPILIIFISKGMEYIRKKLWIVSPIFGVAFICFVTFSYLSDTYKIFINPYKIQEMKPVLNYLKNHKKPNDVIYIHDNAEYAFKYYGKAYGFTDKFDLDKDQYNKGESTFIKDSLSDSPIIIGRKDNGSILKSLIGRKKLWVLFSHAGIHESLILNELDNLGVQLDFFIRRGANGGCSLFLYDLS